MPMSHVKFNKINDNVACCYLFLSPVACHYALCRLSILRKGRVAVSNLGVEGHTGWCERMLGVVAVN